MVVGFITTCAINVYHHRSWEVVLDAILLCFECITKTARRKIAILAVFDILN
jgi:hypothetical protein